MHTVLESHGCLCPPALCPRSPHSVLIPSPLRAETCQTQLTCADPTPAHRLAWAEPPPRLQNPPGPHVLLSLCHRGRAPPVPQVDTVPTLCHPVTPSPLPRVPGGGRWQEDERGTSINPWHHQQPHSCCRCMCVPALRRGCSRAFGFVLLIRGCPHRSVCPILTAPQERVLLPWALAAGRVPVLPPPGAALPGCGTFCLSSGENYTC